MTRLIPGRNAPMGEFSLNLGPKAPMGNVFSLNPGNLFFLRCPNSHSRDISSWLSNTLYITTILYNSYSLPLILIFLTYHLFETYY